MLDNLRKRTYEAFKKELSVILDVKTRWSSLFYMIVRYLEIHMFLNHVLLDHKCFDSNFSFNNKELASLKELADALHPLEIAVKYLSKRNSTLIDAETITIFAIEKLENQETTNFSLI